MEKEFVPYEEALALKELGFNERCFNRYYQSGKLASMLDFGHHNMFQQTNAPLYQQAFKWFREEHNLLHELISVQKDSWLISIRDISSTTKNGVYNGKRWDLDYLDDNIPLTYEEAELACLRKLIEIVKKKRDV